jgi:hypothetical protein
VRSFFPKVFEQHKPDRFDLERTGGVLRARYFNRSHFFIGRSDVRDHDGGRTYEWDEDAPRLPFIDEIGNGVDNVRWYPTKLGRDWEITETLRPLEPFRDHMTVLSGLRQSIPKKDARQVEAYLDAGREMERQIARDRTWMHKPPPDVDKAAVAAAESWASSKGSTCSSPKRRRPSARCSSRC